MLIFLLILGGFAFYVMNTAERQRVLRWVGVGVAVLRRVALIALAGLRTYVAAVRANNRLARVSFGLLLIAGSIVGAILSRQPPTDIRPEIERLLAVESETTAMYDAAAAQFKRGTLDTESLARLIERKIKPQLQGVRVRVMSLDNVRRDHEPLLESAREYLRLRDESWRLRVDALRRRDLKSLQRVELTERASLAALNAAAEAMKQL